MIGELTARDLNYVAGSAIRGGVCPWDVHLGPFYSEDRVASMMEIDDESLDGLVSEGQLLRLRTSDGLFVYPIFQFDEGTPIPGVGEIFRILTSEGVDEWTAAAWLLTRQPHLGNTKPVAWLQSPRDVRRVAWLARFAAKRILRRAEGRSS
jgi:hypothetical protein